MVTGRGADNQGGGQKLSTFPFPPTTGLKEKEEGEQSGLQLKIEALIIIFDWIHSVC